MSIDTYKSQAKRLGDHLQSIHGVKLKHASLLQAIASLHGHKDWNNLAAAANVPTVGTRLKSALGLSGHAAVSRDDGQTLLELMYRDYSQGYLLAKTADNQAPLHLTETDLRSHVLLGGMPGAGCSTAVESILAQALTQGSDFLVIDAKGDDSRQQRIMQMMHAMRSEPLDVLNWGNTDQPQLNLSLCEESADGDLAGLLWEVLHRIPSVATLLADSTDLDKARAIEQLHKWISSARAQDAAKTLSTLAAHLGEQRAGSARGDRLSAAMADALQHLAPTGPAQTLDLEDCLRSNRSTFLRLPLGQDRATHAAITRMVLQLLHRAAWASTSRRKKPFIVVVDLPDLCSALWRNPSVYAQLRGHNICLIFEVPQLHPRNAAEERMVDALLQNTAVKLFFRLRSEDANKVSPTRVNASHLGVSVDALAGLDVGECYISLRAGAARKARIVPVTRLNDGS